MPTCDQCGSYFIPPPCPVCSPPEIERLVEDSPAGIGKTRENLQNELTHLQETLSQKESDFETQTQHLKTRLARVNAQISTLEVSKVSSEAKKRALAKNLANLGEELNALEMATEPLEGDKNSLLERIRNAEETIQSSDAEIARLKEKIERHP